MKVLIFFLFVFQVYSYNFHPYHLLFALNSKFSNKRFPVKLPPHAEYQRAKFFERRQQMYEHEKTRKLIFEKQVEDIRKGKHKFQNKKNHSCYE